jgi:hypothetical protein
MRLAVWCAIALMFAGIAFLCARGMRCQQCHREFGVYRRRVKGSRRWSWLYLCRKHAREWDKTIARRATR